MFFSLTFFFKLMGDFVRCLQHMNKSRDSKVVVYQKAGILLLLFTIIKIWYYFKSFRSKGS